MAGCFLEAKRVRFPAAWLRSVCSVSGDTPVDLREAAPLIDPKAGW